MDYILKNGNAVTPDGVIRTDIGISEGKIAFIGKTEAPGFDATGLLVMPGFIDTHIHGAYGTEFASADEEFDKGLIAEAENGVTSVCCTVRCIPLEEMILAEKNIVKEIKRNPEGAKICGIHLEGPFVSPEFSGSMVKENMRKPSVDEFMKLYEASEGYLKIITVAPELEGAKELISKAKSLGVVVSSGHTAADSDKETEAVNWGISRMTHTFNASKRFSHRDPCAVGVALTDDRIRCEAICDYVHLSPVTVKLIYRAKGASNIDMVSDSGVFAGLGDMDIVVAGHKRIIRNGVCRDEQGHIAGSCYTLHEGVKNLLKDGFAPCDVARMSAENPARSLGADNITGSLCVGKAADIAVLDSDYSVVFSAVNGKIYRNAL